MSDPAPDWWVARLPSEASSGTAFGVNRMTVHHARRRYRARVLIECASARAALSGAIAPGAVA